MPETPLETVAVGSARGMKVQDVVNDVQQALSSTPSKKNKTPMNNLIGGMTFISFLYGIVVRKFILKHELGTRKERSEELNLDPSDAAYSVR